MPQVVLPFKTRSVEIERAGIDAEKRTVPFVFASETPVLCYDWELGEHFEILDCRAASCDLSALTNGGPLLLQHDARAQIGVHESAGFEVDAKKGRVGVATARFSKSARATDEFNDVVDGIKSKFSVRYQPLEMILERTSEEGDFYRVTRWKALENSLVSMPADENCTTRAEAGENISQVKISNPNNLNPMKIKNRSIFRGFKMAPADNAGGEGGAQVREMTDGEKRAAEDKIRKEVETSFMLRQKEINDVVVASRKRDKRDFADLGQKFLMEGKNADQFARAVATSEDFKAWAAEPIGGEIQVRDKDGNLVEDLRRAAAIYLPGDVFARSEGFKKIGQKLGERRSLSVETPEFFAGGRMRATNLTTGLTSINKLPGVIELGARRLTIKDLIAPGLTTETTIRYIRENAMTNAADMVGEGQLKPEQSFDFEEIDASVKKIAAWTKVSDELFKDYLAVASTINMRLPYLVELKEEGQLLSGDGTGQNLTGIMETSGILTQAKAGDTDADALYKALTKIRTGALFGGGYEPDGYVIHPIDWETLRLSKDENGQYYAGGPFTGAYGNGGGAVNFEMLWGKPVVVTPAITQGTALAGAFRVGAQYFQREGMTIDMTNTNEDDFIKNLMTIRAELRIALCVYRPSAFCQITGLGA